MMFLPNYLDENRPEILDYRHQNREGVNSGYIQATNGDVQQHIVITPDTPKFQTNNKHNHIVTAHDNQVANEEVIEPSSENEIVYDGQMKFIPLPSENVPRQQSIVQIHPSTIYQSYLDPSGSSQLEYNHEISASNVSANKGYGWNIQHGPCDNSSQFQVIVAAPPSEDCKDGHNEEQGHVLYSDGGGRQGHWGSDRYYVTDQNLQVVNLSAVCCSAVSPPFSINQLEGQESCTRNEYQPSIKLTDQQIQNLLRNLRPVSKESISKPERYSCDINQNISDNLSNQQQHIKMTVHDVTKMLTNSDQVRHIITGSCNASTDEVNKMATDDINKMAATVSSNENIAQIVEDFVINNIGSIAEKIAQCLQNRNSNQNTESISTTQFPNKPPESPKPKKTLDEAFEDCFEAWGVDTDRGNKSFGLWKDKGSELRLADFVLDKKSQHLPVSWLNVKNSTHICSKKCDTRNSRKRKLVDE